MGGSTWPTWVGTTLFLVSGSVLLWPLGDLFLGPLLALVGLSRPPAPPATSQSLPLPWTAEKFLQESALNPQARMLLLRAEGNLGRALERTAAVTRPVCYLTFREATSSNDLHFALVKGAYFEERLGGFGLLIRSMSIWWMVLWDIVVTSTPSHNRAVNFSVVLQQLRRCVALAGDWSKQGHRPLVIIDHLDEGTRHARLNAQSTDSQGMRSMFLYLVSWSVAMSHDDALADIIILGGPELTNPPRSWFPRRSREIVDPHNFCEQMRRLLA